LAEFTSAGGSASDNNGINASSFQLVSQASDNLTCPETITRVYSIADIDGNISTCSQIIIVHDIIAPSFTIVPQDLVVECDGSNNAMQLSSWLSNIAATDNCVSPAITNDFTSLSDLCGASGSALVTFTATDDCGNSTTTSATFTIIDVTAPSITTQSSDLTVECDGSGNTAELNAWLASNGGADASDICSGTVTWTNNFTTLSDLCGASGSALVIFTATDDCGNSTTTSATLTIIDVTAPSINTQAADLTVECDGSGNTAELNAWLSSNGGADASDICSGTVTWTNNFTTLSDLCGASGSALVIFTATDDCGNSTTTSAAFTIVDVTAPSITTQSADLTVECDGSGNTAELNSWIAANGGADASDICSGTVTWTNNFTTLSDLCGASGSTLVTFTATDDCGNSTTTSATFTIIDVTAPSITTQAADLTVECDGSGNTAELNAWLASNGGADASDICSGTVTWTNNFTTLSDLCGASGSALVIFTATDDCGNTATTSAIFTIIDVTAPVVTCPADIIANTDTNVCGATVIVPQPTIIEDCSAVLITNSVNQTTDASGFYPVGTTEITWTITDECGNTSVCLMTITINDTQAPAITCPSDILTCSTEQPVLVPATATDNCEVATVTNNAPSVFETGTTLVVWTATDIHGNVSTCIQTVVVTPMVVSNAGQDEISCEGQSFTVNTASALNYSSISWNTSGQGTLLNALTLNPTYVPVNGETGNIYLTLTANGMVPCASVTDQMLLTLLPAPMAIAGPDASICENQVFTTSGAFAGNTGSVMWTTSGTGTFADPAAVITSYTPGGEDILNGSVILTLTSTATPPCSNASDNLTLTIHKAATAFAGNDASVCQNAPYQINDASAQNYSAISWTHNGQGIMTGENTLSPVYTPASDESGVISLTLNATGIDQCGNSTDVKNLTIYASPTAFAGADFKSCDNGPVHLASAMVSGAQSVVWTSTGSGTFDNPTLVNATYTPCQSDIDNGSVKLTLTVTGYESCGTDSDDVVITIIPAAKVFAGEGSTICNNSSYTVNDATVTGAISFSWAHDGLGTLMNTDSQNPVYIPAPGETGSVHLFLIALGQVPCGEAIDSLTLQLIPAAVADAGSDMVSCLSEPVQVTNAQVSGYTSIIWTTSGTGSFNNATLPNPVYTPGEADFTNGFVDITLTVTGITPCGSDSDTLRITFNKAPNVSAGSDALVCANEPYTFNSASADNYSSVLWTTNGKGLLSDPTALNPTYTPAKGETGPVEFTLTVNGTSGCENMVVTDMFVLTMKPEIFVNAGNDESIVEGTATSLSGTASGGSGVFAYKWSPEEYLVDYNVLNPVTLPLTANTLFTLTVLDIVSGCSQSDEVLITMGGMIRPLAVDDYDTTDLNTSTLIYVIANDSDPIGLGIDVTITGYPQNGTAVLSENGFINYKPNLNYTGNDTITYRICDRGTPSKCSSALVIITIFPVRVPLEIYNLVIPNGDGMNDTWFIRGIEKYPDNSVMIFNRWGDKLRDFKGYNNSDVVWDGTNQKGEKLPAGTYYYVLTLDDTDTRTGWILLRWDE
jgi:gliding motility-associated-like protein